MNPGPTAPGTDPAKAARSDAAAGAAGRMPPWRALAYSGLTLAVALGLWAWLAPYYWRASALSAIRRGDLDRARVLLIKAVHRLPDDSASRLKLAQLLDIAGETDGAIAELCRLPESVLDSEDVLINLGRMLIATNRPSEAETHLRRCIDRHPRTMRPRQLLLDIYRWQHREEEGRAIRAELAEIAEGGPVADRLWVMARAFIDEYSRIEDQENWEHLLRCWTRDRDDPAVRIAMARHLILHGDRVEEAARDLESLLPSRPGDVAAIASLLEYYLNLASPSIVRAEQLLRDWPEPFRYHSYWRYRGQVLEQRRDERGAIDAYRRALALRPDDLPALNRLSALLARSGDASLVAEAAGLAERLHGVHEARGRCLALVAELEEWFGRSYGTGRGPRASLDRGIALRMAEFYRGTGRADEARLWSEMHEELGRAGGHARPRVTAN